MFTRPTSTSGGRTGRQLGAVFAATAVVGALVGGTVSYLTAGDDVTHLEADLIGTVASPSPGSRITTSAMPRPGDTAQAAGEAQAGAVAGVAPVVAGEPAASAGQPPPAAGAAGSGTQTSDPTRGESPAPVPAQSTQAPDPKPAGTTSPPAAGTPTPASTASSPPESTQPPQKGSSGG